MLDKLKKLIKHDLITEIKSGGWESLIINKRKPHTYRMFKQIGEDRVCLHKFEACDLSESFLHPHPWPAAFVVLAGSYTMEFGISESLSTGPSFCEKFTLVRRSEYEMLNNRSWHSVTPNRTTYTVMLNGPPFKHQHRDTRTTKGKDLESFSDQMLKEELELFADLVDDYNKETIYMEPF